MPILVNQRRELVDGAGRLSLAREFGWRRIPARIVDMSPTEYLAVQRSQNRLRGNDVLSIYLHSPAVLDPAERARYDAMYRAFGPAFTREVAEAGYGLGIYQCARDVVIYVRNTIPLLMIARWLMRHRLSTRVAWLMAGNIPPQRLRGYIRRNQTVDLSL